MTKTFAVNANETSVNQLSLHTAHSVEAAAGESPDGYIVDDHTKRITTSDGTEWRLEPPTGRASDPVDEVNGDYPMRKINKTEIHYGGRVVKLKYESKKIYALSVKSTNVWMEATGDGKWQVVAGALPQGPALTQKPVVDQPPAVVAQRADVTSAAGDTPLPRFGPSRLAIHDTISTMEGNKGSVAQVGKHAQAVYMKLPSAEKGYVYLSTGDMDELMLPMDGNLPNAAGKTLNTVLQLNNSAPRVEQMISWKGNKGEPMMYRLDGVTVAPNPATNEIIFIKGNQAEYKPEFDPYRNMKPYLDHVLAFNVVTHSFRVGSNIVWNGVRKWGIEGWGGATHKRTQVVVAQMAGGSYGKLSFYDIQKDLRGENPWNEKPLQRSPDVYDWGNGPELDTWHWAQVIIGDLLYCYCGRRGIIYYIDFLSERPIARKLVRVPKCIGNANEPVETVEAGFTGSELRRELFLTTLPARYVEGGEAGIYITNIETRTTTFARFPKDTHGTPKEQGTVACWDDTNSMLCVTGNSSDRNYAGKWIRYQYADATTAAAAAAVPSAVPLKWLGEIGELKHPPNSVASAFFINRGGISPSYLADAGIKVPAQLTDRIDIPPNENGVSPPPNVQGRPFIEFRSYSGNWWKTRSGGPLGVDPMTMFIAGDSGGLTNDVMAYTFSNNPQWIRVIKGTHVSKYRNGNLDAENAAAATRGRKVSQHIYRHLDGVGFVQCHRYFGSHYWEDTHELLQIDSNNRYPTDTGHSAHVVIANATKQAWLAEEPIDAPMGGFYPDAKVGTSTETPWCGIDVTTQIIRALRNNTLCELNPRTRRWRRNEIRRDNASSLDDGCAVYCHTDGDYLFGCCDHASLLPESKKESPERINWWLRDSAGNYKKCSISGPGARYLSYTPELKFLPRYWNFEWIPSWNAPMLFGNDGRVYRFERVAETEFRVTVWMSGIPKAKHSVGAGTITKLRYIERGGDKFVVWHPSDREPMDAWRVAA